AAHAAHCAARHMVARGATGRIINISSRGAFRGEPECPAYGASKAGINAFSQSMALALGSHGIGVFAVAPGFVETAMARPWLDGAKADAIKRQSPLGRVATVGDVAYWVLCLADPEAAFATGTIVDVNGASYLRS
ncbi:MAG: SDR family oxidoreductase, partial [Acidobacteriota bacterium]